MKFVFTNLLLQFRQSGLSLAQYVYNENDTDTKIVVKRLKEYAVALASKIENQLVSAKELEEMVIDVYQFEKSLKEVYLLFVGCSIITST